VSALAFIEAVVPGEHGGMEDKENNGKMIVYLYLMLQTLATRLRAMGILIDGRHAALYVATKDYYGRISYARSKAFSLDEGNMQHEPNFVRCAGALTAASSSMLLHANLHRLLHQSWPHRGAWNAGGFAMMGQLIAADHSVHGYAYPMLGLESEPEIVGALGHGRCSDVFLASDDGEEVAMKVLLVVQQARQRTNLTCAVTLSELVCSVASRTILSCECRLCSLHAVSVSAW
jgi:hypothetical protein